MNRYSFTIRSLLLLTAIVGLALALFMQHFWRMERLAKLHARQAEFVVARRDQLNRASFDVPDTAWLEFERQELEHRRLTNEYRRKIWQPWLYVRPPTPPLPIQVE